MRNHYSICYDPLEWRCAIDYNTRIKIRIRVRNFLEHSENFFSQDLISART